MGMHVVAIRRTATRIEQNGGVEIHPPDALRDLLPHATALIVCLPLTPET